jgi:ribonuclease HI
LIDLPCLDWDLAVGFFDGASQEWEKSVGQGCTKMPSFGTYRIKMNCGSGTNTKGELLALWCILYFANVLKVTRLLLAGDSKIIIDWFNNVNNLQVLSLQPWMEKIRRLSGSFLQLKAHHIYRTFNKEVDQMSKEALQLDEEGVFFSKITDGLPRDL